MKKILFYISILLISFNAYAITPDTAGNLEKKVKVSSNDTTSGFLNGKLVCGSNITCTEGNDGGDETFTISASGDLGYSTVADEGSGLTQRNTVNFTGNGISCVDNSGSTRTDCTVSTGTTFTVQSNDSTVSAVVNTVDFSSDFTVTESPSGEANISPVLTPSSSTTLTNKTITSGSNVVDTDSIKTIPVCVGTPTTGQVMKYSGSDWCAGTDTGGQAYDTVQDEGSSVTQRATLNFTGAGVSCSDNASKTECVINAGSATSTVQNADSTVDGAVTVFDFDAGFTVTSSPSGEANISVATNGHTHTGSTISSLDISDDTNLTAGDHITLTGDDLDVDDHFILNSGDAGTGVYDFGGADSFETVNGTNPTVNADGEFAEDTTANDWVYGSSANVMTFKKQFGQSIYLPTAGTYTLFKARYPMTISDIHCIIDPADTGESVSIEIKECDATADNCATVDAAITCDNDGAEDDGSLSNGTIDANDWVAITVGSPSGTVTNAAYSVFFTKTRE